MPKQVHGEKEAEKLGALVAKRQMQKDYYSKINQVRAESIVIKNMLEVSLIKMASEMICQESNALQSVFEISAIDRKL